MKSRIAAASVRHLAACLRGSHPVHNRAGNRCRDARNFLGRSTGASAYCRVRGMATRRCIRELHRSSQIRNSCHHVFRRSGRFDSSLDCRGRSAVLCKRPSDHGSPFQPCSGPGCSNGKLPPLTPPAPRLVESDQLAWSMTRPSKLHPEPTLFLLSSASTDPVRRTEKIFHPPR